MCGIAGILDLYDRQRIDRSILKAMTDAQEHRGPDDSGFHLDTNVGLGHRRLSIIDLTSGHQPLFNEDRSVVVTYNGEIYNFLALKKELEAKGHVFRTICDTEVIVHAWEEWREKCVERFRGMFAFALWDRNSRTLFLARDRLGIKPFYYSVLPNGLFLFASELKGLLAHPDLPRRIDPHAVADFFAYGYVPDPKSIYSDVTKLPPGCYLTVRPGEDVGVPRVYWDVTFENKIHVNEEDAAEALIEKFKEAVKIRMIADVPLGAFLSGGVDSSGVVAMMAQASEDPVDTCSISFGDPRFDESAYAARVADRYATRHHTHQVTADSLDVVSRIPGVYDEPFADSSAIPTYHLCRLTRNHVKVALSGDGGDELFAGYRRYRWHHYEEQMRGILSQGFRQVIFGALGFGYPKLAWAPRILRAKATLQALSRNSVEGYFWSLGITPPHILDRLLGQDLKSALKGYDPVDLIGTHFTKAPTEHPVERAQYTDIKTYLPGDILTKVDRASMAHSLEVRVPILDHEFVEWAASLPADLRFRKGAGKYILKKALGAHVDEEVLYRPKMGFAVPMAKWFRGPLYGEISTALEKGSIRTCNLVDCDFAASLAEAHLKGRQDHSAVLWALLMFERFLEHVHYGKQPLQPEPLAKIEAVPRMV
jgi:asparagine synthase (glutamine-hydrolysing)